MALMKGNHWIRHISWSPIDESEPVYIEPNSGSVYRLGVSAPIGDLTQWEIGPPIDDPPVFGNAATPAPATPVAAQGIKIKLDPSGTSSWVYVGGGNIPPAETKTCDYCKGNGGGVMGGRCPVCGGSGVVATA